MASGRIYRVPFKQVAVSAVQDLISVQSTSGMAFEVHEVVIGQITASTIGNLPISMKRVSGAYTIGSGGNTSTPVKVNSGDVAATVTGRINDTTQTSGGTSTVLKPDVFNVLNGYIWLPAPENRDVIAPGQAWVLSLDAAPGSSQTMSGYVTIKELF